jgi:hypothetical protein
MARFPNNYRQTDPHKPDGAKRKQRQASRAAKDNYPGEVPLADSGPFHLFIPHDRVLMDNDIRARDRCMDLGLDFLGHPM